MKFQNGFADGPSPILQQSTLFAIFGLARAQIIQKNRVLKLGESRGVSGILAAPEEAAPGESSCCHPQPQVGYGVCRIRTDCPQVGYGVWGADIAVISTQSSALRMGRQSSCLPILRQAARKPWRPRHWPTALQNSKRDEASVRTAGGDQNTDSRQHV